MFIRLKRDGFSKIVSAKETAKIDKLVGDGYEIERDTKGVIKTYKDANEVVKKLNTTSGRAVKTPGLVDELAKLTETKATETDKK